jgi:hypothetical protein
MYSNNVIENITNYSKLSEKSINEFMSPDQLIQLAYAKLEYLKALYRNQLGYECVSVAPVAVRA